MVSLSLSFFFLHVSVCLCLSLWYSQVNGLIKKWAVEQVYFDPLFWQVQCNGICHWQLMTILYDNKRTYVYISQLHTLIVANSTSQIASQLELASQQRCDTLSYSRRIVICYGMVQVCVPVHKLSYLWYRTIHMYYVAMVATVRLLVLLQLASQSNQLASLV